MASSKLSYKFKMILLGESGSGKTTLFHRIIYDTFERSRDPKSPTTPTSNGPSVPSLGSSRYRNRIKEVRVSGSRGSTTVNVAVYDTGGEERVKFMTLHYYENAQIVCLVYAMDNLASLTSLNAWAEDAQEYLSLKTQHSVAKPVYALVGVKSDISLDEREVTSEDVEQAADRFEIPRDCCFEVSSASGDGVTEMVQRLAQKAYDLHTLSASTELKDYTSLKSVPLQTPEEPIKKPKQWSCWRCCLYCCKAQRRDYETLDST